MYDTHTHHDHTTDVTTLTQHVAVQIGIVLLVTAIVLWAVFLANYPPVHDTFHELRHALYVIPCH